MNMPSVCGANYNVLHVLSMMFVCVHVTICENVMVCRWCKYDHICNITASLNLICGSMEHVLMRSECMWVWDGERVLGNLNLLLLLAFLLSSPLFCLPAMAKFCYVSNQQYLFPFPK